MGDDYSSASLFSQPLSGGTLVQAKIGKARICGTIEKDSGVSASVVPTAADVISSASSYAVYAWGTKADGTEVPQTSPINGTVSSGGAGVTFSIDLDYGTWTVRADALDSSSNVVLSKTTAEPLVLDEDNPLANLSFSLSYLQDPSVPGSLSLTLNYSTTAGIASIRYSLQKKSGGSPLAGTVAAPASGTFTLDSTASSGLGTLVPGDYDLVAEFLSATGATIMRLDQVVQIYSNITTNKIDGSAPYISGGSVNVSDSVITKYQQSVVYVGGTGVNTGKAASDANNGTQFDPVETLGRAFAIADSLISVPTDGVKIYVQDNISLAQDIAIASSKKIRVIGTNQSAPWTISGASSGAATFSITSSGDFSCSYIIFDKINGFEVAGGQTNLSNCKITNGKEPAGKDGGGGLCVDVGGAKAVLTNCQISGCHSAGLGGAIHVAADSGTAEVELTDCLIGEESASCATNTEFSNHSNQAGGAINVGSGGKLVLTDTKILYNSAPANPGGGIRCMAGTVEISGGQINHNYAGYGGGGIFIMGPASAVTINDCAIGELSSAAAATGLSDCGNYSYDQGGGGIQIESGTLSTTSGFSVIKNYSVKKGGGLNINGAASVTLVSSTISHNASASSGGGVCAAQTTTLFSMTGGAVSDNKAAGNGGGLSLDTTDSASGTFKDVLVKSNEAAGNGGGIQITNGRFLTMTGACDVSGNKADNGGGVYASGTLKMQGGTISGNTATSGGGAYVSGGKLLMSGSAYIPAGADKKNDVYLTDSTSVTIGSTLDAATTPVATITPATYAPGTAVLSDTGTGVSAGALVQSELSKIAVTPQSADDEWTIGYDSSTKKGVLATANIYVSGGSDGNDTTGTGSSATPYKTVAFALTKVLAPNCSIIIKESTTESEALNVTAAMTGLTIKSADTAQKTITGDVSKEIRINSAATISKIVFDTWAGVNVDDDVDTVELNDVAIKNSFNAIAGGGLYLDNNAKVRASNLEVSDCYVTAGSGGGIYIGSGAKLDADGLVVADCHVDGTSNDGGGIYNSGTLIAKYARISGCTATGNGAGIFNDNGATLVLDGDCNIDSQIYLFGGSSTLPAKPIYVKAYFGLASGAPKIPVTVEERNVAGNQFQEGDAVVQGWDTYDIKEAQVNCFATSGTALSLEYDGAATPPCGKLVDKSIAGGVTVNLGGSILFEIGTPSASGEKARFNVIDNSSGTPTYVTPTSAQIKILQYGTPVYSAAAQEVTATYLPEGEYELYCKAVVGGVAYDTTLPFGAGGKYTPLTLEAAAAGAKVTFTNKAADVVTYKKNGGAAQTIASGDSAEITLDNIGDKVQFYGTNAKYGASGGSANCSNISCTDECYVYGNVMSLVKSDGFASEDTLTGTYNFAYLFYNNTKIRNKTGYVLVLPATTLTEDCYYAMFYGCSLIEVAPELPATTLEKECYYAMFCNCASLKTVPALSATTLANESCQSMFCNCTSLETAPELPATNLASWCYHGMFSGCSSLTAAPALPATTLASSCYENMFKGCTSLATAPELPATTLASYCYKNMFNGCTSLATALALPATTLAYECYYAMFYGCTSLATAPALPATTLAEGCYNGMFLGCTSLTAAPELSAMTLATQCYQQMFNECTSLATAPALPATTLASWCYYGMFRNCKELTTAPELPATILKYTCYKQMFKGCTKLNSVTCLATDISAEDCTADWLSGVAATGTFTKAAAMADWTIDSANGIPTGWTVESVGSAVPAGFVVVEGSTVIGGDKFKDTYSNAGVFVSGRSVAISTFWICDHEITQAEYSSVMDGENPSNWTGDDLPVEKVSWYDAIYYCNKKSIADHLNPCYVVGGKDDPSQWGYTPHAGNSISGTITCDFSKNGYRLPTEAEWEYAARGGKAGCESTTPNSWAGTNNSAELGTYAWYDTNSENKTHNVKTKTKNSLDLYDMSGNVLEWCWDWYNNAATINDDAYKVNGVVTNPAGASSGSVRVYRGGGWGFGANYCSVAGRFGVSPNLRYDYLGFRVVRTAP